MAKDDIVRLIEVIVVVILLLIAVVNGCWHCGYLFYECLEKPHKESMTGIVFLIVTSMVALMGALIFEILIVVGGVGSFKEGRLTTAYTISLVVGVTLLIIGLCVYSITFEVKWSYMLAASAAAIGLDVAVSPLFALISFKR
ncbi:unnamed protein product [Calicophoron daubneyi]|uniref:Uncharacterized protein n=1 Tax=Calicophoron daubneyi TaxID=300641 RepID=A0AAV2T007_CALDB